MLENLENVRGKKVTVVGLGRTSIALVRLLLREGGEPYVTDCSDTPEMSPFKTALNELNVPLECGGHTQEAFRHASLVIPSPGVPPTIAVIRDAALAGATVVSEIEFAYPFCTSRILAVTGTNGKTTTTELLRAMVAECGHSVSLAGNNATPFSQCVLQEAQLEYVVLEVSSYQLELANRFRPSIAAVLNVTPDHLTRHGSIVEYAAAKARLLINQTRDDAAIINVDDPLVKIMAQTTNATVFAFSTTRSVRRGLWIEQDAFVSKEGPVAQLSDTTLPGRHNLQNVLAALTIMKAGAFEWEKVVTGLRKFRGVEHRIEYVATINGVAYYNDSKSTNVDSLRVALESFSKPIVLIAGGQGKGSDYRALRNVVQSRVTALVALGEDAPKLDEAFRDILPCHRAGDMPEAVACAADLAKVGDIVLLSPACASFDMFADFEHRGRVFKEWVRTLAGDTSHET